MDYSEKQATYGTQEEEKQNKNTTQYELDTNNVNKTSTPLQTSSGKDEIYGKPIYFFRNIFHEVLCVL